MISCIGLSHINIVVPNINEAINYYKKLFNTIPLQIFPHFKNIGFAKSAGFMDNPKEIDVTIAFLQIPNTTITIELMEYHSPLGVNKNNKILTYQIGNIGHVALKVTNIDGAFEFLKTLNNEITLISQHPKYKPYKIDNITIEDFKFFDKELENNSEEKQNVANIVSKIKYFYFIDKYGIQWELEEGHSDIGD